MLNALRRKAQNSRIVESLHAALNAQARLAVFFQDYGVADTIDGRFDMLALHAWMVLSRLNAAGREDLADGLTDTLFAAFDAALRDLGTGDMGMGPRIKKLGNALNGRVVAYEAAASDEAAFAEAVLRNVYRGEAGHEREARSMARYAIAARAALNDLTGGEVEFVAVPPPLE